VTSEIGERKKYGAGPSRGEQVKRWESVGKVSETCDRVLLKGAWEEGVCERRRHGELFEGGTTDVVGGGRGGKGW